MQSRENLEHAVESDTFRVEVAYRRWIGYSLYFADCGLSVTDFQLLNL